MPEFVSRAGQKLEHALATFAIDVRGLVCADLGSNVGGFVDCLLQRQAARVYAVDAGYGVLAWKLRRDPRVVVMERTNAMHVSLPEAVSFVCIDVAWTKQRHILPAAARLIQPGSSVVTLIKPHYEAPPALLRKGVLPEERLAEVLQMVQADIAAAGFELVASLTSPVRGAKGNIEVLGWLRAVAALSANAAGFRR
jgi:23S rRNA (cytidine1920-2'-O)/16S rRNA (cytidine1409-2'-O)-methyltransferase